MPFDDEFDRQIMKTHKTVTRLAVAGFIAAGVGALMILGGVAWAAYLLLSHFGVI